MDQHPPWLGPRARRRDPLALARELLRQVIVWTGSSLGDRLRRRQAAGSCIGVLAWRWAPLPVAMARGVDQPRDGATLADRLRRARYALEQCGRGPGWSGPAGSGRGSGGTGPGGGGSGLC